MVDTTTDTDQHPLPVRAPILRRQGGRRLVLSPPRRLYLLVLIAALFVAVGYLVAEKALRPHRPWLWLLLLFPLSAVKLYANWLKVCFWQSVLFDRGAKRVFFGKASSGTRNRCEIGVSSFFPGPPGRGKKN